MKTKEAKQEFLLSAIHYTYETIRFLETKAGVIVATETLLLAFAIACLTEPGRQDFIMRLLRTDYSEFALLLIVYFLFYVAGLLYLIFRTIQIFLPCKCIDLKAHLGDHKPKRLFYLDEFDETGQLKRLFNEHVKDFSQMKKAEIKQEYIYELRKLSCIRRIKSAKITKTLNQLWYVIVGAVILGIMVLVGEFWI